MSIFRKPLVCVALSSIVAAMPAAGENAGGAARLRLSVDGQRAMSKARELVKLGPRPSGSEGALRAAQWLLDQSRADGCHCSLQAWVEETVRGRVVFRNVVVVREGDLDGRVLVGSHYDTKRLPDIPDFRGANDSASSSALLLELIRVTGEIPKAERCTLEFVFFDGEECVDCYGPGDGLHGSRKHANIIRRTGTADQYRAMILLDMVGDADLKITLPKDSDPALADKTFSIAKRLGVSDRFCYFERAPSILDDHLPFQRLGIPAIDLIDFEYGPGNSYWHTEEDTLDKLSAASLEIVGSVAAELIRSVAAGDR